MGEKVIYKIELGNEIRNHQKKIFYNSFYPIWKIYSIYPSSWTGFEWLFTIILLVMYNVSKLIMFLCVIVVVACT